MNVWSISKEKGTMAPEERVGSDDQDGIAGQCYRGTE
jgi:hypothetical protein